MKQFGKVISILLLSFMFVFATIGCGGETQEQPEEENYASENENEENKDEEEASGEEGPLEEEEGMDPKEFQGKYFTNEVEVNQGLSNWIENNKDQAAVHQYPDDDNLYMIAAGEKNTGGYSVVVTEEQFDGKKLTLYYEIQSPGPDDMVTQAITYPYILIEITEDVEDVIFVKQ